MTSISARFAAVTVALYFAYEIVAGVLTAASQLGTMLSQQSSGADMFLWWVAFIPRAVPYVIAGFVVFWLWPARSPHTVTFAVVARAAVAAVGGAVISILIGAISATTVTGGWFTSQPRQYSFPEWYLGQLPSMLLSGILQNLPVLALAALVALAMLRGRNGDRAFDRRERIE